MGMADVKVLTGERVTLRAPRLEDAEELFASVASDPEVTRYMSWKTHPAVDETRRVITELFNVGGERTWLIELRNSGEILGTCGFRPVQAHSMDFGYCLGRRWWGQGLMARLSLSFSPRWNPIHRCTESLRYAMSTTSVRPVCWNGPACRSKAGWSGTPSSRTSAPSRRMSCSSPRRSGSDAPHRPCPGRQRETGLGSRETVAQPRPKLRAAGLGQRSHVHACGPLPAEERLPEVIE